MKFDCQEFKEKRKPADLLVIPFWKDDKNIRPALEVFKTLPEIELARKSGDFKAKEGEVCFLYSDSQPENRIALLGLGDSEKITVEKLRRAYGSLVKNCRSKQITKLNLLTPHIGTMQKQQSMRGIAEGLLLTNYSFDQLKSESIKDEPTVLLKQINFIGVDEKALAIADKYSKIAEAVYFTRDLVNGNADDVTPKTLGQIAMDFAKKLSHVKSTVFSKSRIEKEKMGLILAVSRGAVHDPAFIIIEYKGDAKSKDNTVIVGKGVTYDTGGLNLKPIAGMDTMKCDMSGAATVLGTILAAAKLKLKVNLTGVIPSVENAIGPSSYKPGDVFKSYQGKTVEIKDTDAEGRLILADALAYAVKNLKPSRIIDFATLTGAIGVALGEETAGLFSNHDALADSLLLAGSETFERLWRMPIFEEYRDQLKSDIADMKNTGGRLGGSITASLFLKDFVGDTPWAHCDIAYTAYLSEARRYNPKYATGMGVRLMIEFLEQLRG